MNALHRHLAACAAEAARVAARVPAGAWDAPTPCAGFDLRALVNHWVLYTAYGLEFRARREPVPDELAARDFTRDPDWAARYEAQLGRAVAAWEPDEVWEGDIDLGGMSFPAEQVAGLIIKEMAVHGWDVARSTGQEFRVADDTGELLLRVVQEHAETYRRYDGFAEPVPIGPDASAFDRALAASGRDPRRRS
ncbi:TIGR03086 family metal-binding protein [Actinomadura flavalba]|uniref:TIGR03086 family metal-binding protein n=1 Tax=Actinomadura flavalba TaxID=1120938 RepID=UPI0003746314|nr:TIGR03086 family metal-binding protein [Actinomadura flavalba]